MRYLKAENLKFRHSVSKKLAVLFPVFTFLLSLLSGSFMQLSALNWWYTTMLPGCLSILCALADQKDGKKLGYGIWLFVPWAWSVRLCGYLVLPMRYASASAFAAALRSGALVAAFASCAAFAVFLVWFGRWEGARPDE